MTTSFFQGCLIYQQKIPGQNEPLCMHWAEQNSRFGTEIKGAELDQE